MPNSKVCVIGAGVSGIVAAKTLHERGVPFDCFEKGSGIGGLWRYNNDNNHSAAYRSLHINTSRKRTEFPDFHMPRHYPDFPHHALMLEYFENYVDHFGFREAITFQATVLAVRTLGPEHYAVTWQDRQGQKHTDHYRAVVVANGHHWSPRHPEFPGRLDAEVMHAHDYRTPDAMHGKRVLVVGIGNSGCDIACEVSRVASQVFLSTRRGAHIIPKYLFGKPLDRFCPPFVWKHAPHWLFKRIFAAALRIARGRQARFGLPSPSHAILEEHPTISSDLLNLVGHGRVAIKPNVASLEGRDVRFDDGSREAIDLMITATGYNIVFPFLDADIIDPVENDVSLYKRIAHPDHAGLYFIGLIQPWGSIMQLVHYQAQWIADVLVGATALPGREAMRREIARRGAKMRKRYTHSARHTIQVDFYEYIDALKREHRVKGREMYEEHVLPRRKAA